MEMVSAKAIFYHSKNTESLMEIAPQERPVSLQLFGSDADIISEMAGSYFTGDKGLDETASLIQGKVQLYINENR